VSSKIQFETGIGDDLGADVAGEAAPQTDLQPALLERLLEDVAAEFHGLVPSHRSMLAHRARSHCVRWHQTN
jgi:hypothetical protein